jgi:hypothetical protein
LKPITAFECEMEFKFIFSKLCLGGFQSIFGELEIFESMLLAAPVWG